MDSSNVFLSFQLWWWAAVAAPVLVVLALVLFWAGLRRSRLRLEGQLRQLVSEVAALRADLGDRSR